MKGWYVFMAEKLHSYLTEFKTITDSSNNVHRITISAETIG